MFDGWNALGDINESNDVLLRSPVDGVSAKFNPKYIENQDARPPPRMNEKSS